MHLIAVCAALQKVFGVIPAAHIHLLLNGRWLSWRKSNYIRLSCDHKVRVVTWLSEEARVVLRLGALEEMLRICWILESSWRCRVVGLGRDLLLVVLFLKTLLHGYCGVRLEVGGNQLIKAILTFMVLNGIYTDHHLLLGLSYWTFGILLIIDECLTKHTSIWTWRVLMVNHTLRS